MKESRLSFLFKVVLLSVLISLLIKYCGTRLPSYASTTEFRTGIALLIVLMPSVIVGAFLLARTRAN